jgi:hypothetical protein
VLVVVVTALLSMVALEIARVEADILLCASSINDMRRTGMVWYESGDTS